MLDASACFADTRRTSESRTRCKRRLERIALIAPWGTATAGTFDGHALVFDVDWKRANFDVLDDDVVSELRSAAWRFESGDRREVVMWRPSERDVTAMIASLAAVRELAVDERGRVSPAQLSVVSLSAEEPGLIAGQHGRLTLTLRNDGMSAAHRVTAQIRSEHAALDGVRVEFGSLQPGADATRTIDVALSSMTARDQRVTLVVLVSTLRYRDAATFDREIIIGRSPSIASMDVLCARQRGHEHVYPGQTITLSCTLANVGTAPVKGAEVVVGVDGATLSHVQISHAIQPGAMNGANIHVRIPTEYPVGVILTIDIAVRTQRASAAVRRQLRFQVVERPVCLHGKLDDATFEREMNALKRQHKRERLGRDVFRRKKISLIACRD